VYPKKDGWSWKVHENPIKMEDLQWFAGTNILANLHNQYIIMGHITTVHMVMVQFATKKMDGLIHQLADLVVQSLHHLYTHMIFMKFHQVHFLVNS
jgi:hypothetical protein